MISGRTSTSANAWPVFPPAGAAVAEASAASAAGPWLRHLEDMNGRLGSLKPSRLAGCSSVPAPPALVLPAGPAEAAIVDADCWGSGFSLCEGLASACLRFCSNPTPAAAGPARGGSGCCSWPATPASLKGCWAGCRGEGCCCAGFLAESLDSSGAGFTEGPADIKERRQC